MAWARVHSSKMFLPQRFSDYTRADIREARAVGAIPILATPLPQRNYKDGRHVRTLEDYAAAMRAVRKETGTVVLDLNAVVQRWTR